MNYALLGWCVECVGTSTPYFCLLLEFNGNDKYAVYILVDKEFVVSKVAIYSSNLRQNSLKFARYIPNSMILNIYFTE